MFEGKLVGIFVAAEKNVDLRGVAEIAAVAGQGLQGDRYFQAEAAAPDREITLIEIEALEALERETQIRVEPHQTRRNLVTRGVPLNHLIGVEFRIGDAVLRGIRLCEPCKHLEGLTCMGVLKGLVHRGGLRAQVLQGGTLRPGDVILPNHSAQAATPDRGPRLQAAGHPSRG